MTLFFVSILFSYLLVCELPMFALKFKNFGLKDNAVKYGFIAASVLLIILFHLYALPLVILLYIAVSFVLWMVGQMKSDELKY